MVEEWCECLLSVPIQKNKAVICNRCGKQIACEICKQKATILYVDYIVCEDHRDYAIGNEMGRNYA